jgi:flagellar hook protein FlgE
MGSAMNSAVSGLRAHQLMLDVTGNNIANVNTPGYKVGRTTFADVLSQTLAGATRPTGTTGGTDPKQVGLGVRVGGVTNLFTQGGLLVTNRPTDLAIQGEGFFVLNSGNGFVYTRAGTFEVDADGYLVDSVTGYRVQGTAQGDIQIFAGASALPRATQQAAFSGNLDSAAAAGSVYTTTLGIFDSLGTPHELGLSFTKSAAAGEYVYAVTVPATESTLRIAAGGSGRISFDENGALIGGASAALVLDFSNGAASGQNVLLDFGTSANGARVTGVASPSTLAQATQDGYGPGTLQSFSIGANGSINGTFSNGRVEELDTILLATFSNPAGLSRIGNNLFRESANSGLANVGAPEIGGRGSLAPGALESSNVDLAEEFTRLILAQRGFQANARVITTSDEVLAEAVNLKR